MVFHVQRHGFVTTTELIASIVSDMVANGFEQKFPSTPLASPAAPYKVTLSAGAGVDPYHAAQEWRVHFNVIDDFQAKMYVASDVQLPDDGTVAKLEVGFSRAQDSAGVIGSDVPYPFLLDATTLIIPPTDISTGQVYSAEAVARSKRINNADRQFIDRSIRLPDLATAANYPMSYYLSISDRGFVVVVWEEGQDVTGDRTSWVAVQRPVDRDTGDVMPDTTKSPVFCLYGLKDSYVPAAIRAGQGSAQPQIIYPERWEPGTKKFIVREKDVLKPTQSVPASYDTEDSAAVLNAVQQVAITEDNKYVVTFPSRLNTPRYTYTNELDMVAFTSADVVSQFAAVPNTVYGESGARTYRALTANKPNNTGMRLLVLEQEP